MVVTRACPCSSADLKTDTGMCVCAPSTSHCVVALYHSMTHLLNSKILLLPSKHCFDFKHTFIDHKLVMDQPGGAFHKRLACRILSKVHFTAVQPQMIHFHARFTSTTGNYYGRSCSSILSKDCGCCKLKRIIFARLETFL